MSYQKTISYLFGLQKFGIKLGLSKITSLLKQLGDPHKKLRFIHIAGSNGKGSTAAFLTAILRQNGHRAALYTSPHLIDFTERIKICDKAIPRSRVVGLTRRIKRICSDNAIDSITYFEFITAMALTYFAEEHADPVVFEVGMGGRFDATNVIRPLVSIITSINMEHQIYLGNTLSKIAREKAGIIKRRVPLVSGVRQASVKKILAETCTRLHARHYQLGDDFTCRSKHNGLFSYKGLNWEFKELKSGLLGNHQLRNASLAVCAAELINKKGVLIEKETVKQAIHETSWPGRFEIIQKNPVVVLDGAHNPAAWKTLINTLRRQLTYKHLYFVIGIMEDKDIAKLVELVTPLGEAIVFCRPGMQRAAKKEFIEKFIRFSSKKKVFWYDDTKTAIKYVIKNASKNDVIAVTGSLFTVGEAREYFLQPRAFSSGRIGM